MDEGLVSAFPSLDEDEGSKKNTPLKTYTDTFNEYFPFYLAEGMSYEAFWDDDVDIVKAYRKAYKIKRDKDNFNAFLIGNYVYDALVCVAPALASPFNKHPKIEKYHTAPYELDDSHKKEKEQSKEQLSYETGLAQMKAWANAFNKKLAKGESKDA